MQLILFITAVWLVIQVGGYQFVVSVLWGDYKATKLFKILFHIPCCIGLIWMAFDFLYRMGINTIYKNTERDTWLNKNLYK